MSLKKSSIINEVSIFILESDSSDETREILKSIQILNFLYILK